MSKRWWRLYWPAVAILAGLGVVGGLVGGLIGLWATPLMMGVGLGVGGPLGRWMFHRYETWADANDPDWWKR